MLSKTSQAVRLSIKEASMGAWISVAGTRGSAQSGISVRSDIQYFYVHAENRNETLVYFWNYREFVKTVIQPIGVDYKRLHPDSVRDLVRLHDRLIETHIDARIQIILRSQVLAGFREYATINDEVCFGLSPYIFADVQKYKLAAAMMFFVLRFQTPLANKKFASYDSLVGEQMENWRGLLSGTGKAYPILNRTIDNWFGTVPRTIQNLRQLQLEKPKEGGYPNHQNVRLLLAMFEVDKERFPQEERDALAHLIQLARPNDIQMLLKMPQVNGGARRGHGANNNPPLNLVNYILDGIRIEGESYMHIRSLSDAWNRSYRAHEEAEQRRLIQQRKMDEAQRAGHAAWMETKTAELPHPLPEGKGIRFLDTVQACHDEHRLMKHCIDTYSKDAVMGKCWLFHVDYKGEMASAEVSPEGIIRQVRGPHNHMNDATDYAARVLTEWVQDWKAAKANAQKEKAKQSKNAHESV